MELKQIKNSIIIIFHIVLIVPYGIETTLQELVGVLI